MNTLIFNGSPRPNGDTSALIAALTEALEGRVDIINCYRANIRPCVDCRACKDAFACAILDEMQAVYARILEADAIVIASPVYFSSLTGRTLDVLSRLQPGFYARSRGEAGFSNKARRGGTLLVGGGNGSAELAVKQSRLLLRAMNCAPIAEPVMSLNTDRLPAARDFAALDAARRLARFLNGV
ncbi:MAG: NAD(P)H-dependent oxidoreductase [Clostridia bacterium]|nr:NAD(P)H-dependent oxidoreductase [Clostridia bacterium]